MASFLEGELKKIVKRKADHHPSSEQVPTKLGRFVVEGEHPLDSNPNYALFQRALSATTVESFNKESESFVNTYLKTSAVRGGVFLVCQAKPEKYYSDSFLFLLKCDFQDNIATLSDANTLIQKVERAITTKNMKSIQYPHMIEEGMVEEHVLKIHQSSHARYFEDFLPHVEYGDPIPFVLKKTKYNRFLKSMGRKRISRIVRNEQFLKRKSRIGRLVKQENYKNSLISIKLWKHRLNSLPIHPM